MRTKTRRWPTPRSARAAPRPSARPTRDGVKAPPRALRSSGAGACGARATAARIDRRQCGVGSNDTRSRIYGGAAGFDYRLTPDTLVGFSLGGAGTIQSCERPRRRPLGDVPGRRLRPPHLRPGLHRSRARLWLAGRHDGPHRALEQLSRQLRCERDLRTPRRRLSLRASARAASRRMRRASSRASSCRTTPSSRRRREHVRARLRREGRHRLAQRTRPARRHLVRACRTPIVTLRGRAAWAHNFNTDRSIGAIFQTLPASAFIVNGAAQARDARSSPPAPKRAG